MEKLRTKESLRSYPEISQPLADTHDPGGRAVVGSVGWVFLLLFSFPAAWHVTILCLCVKSHPLPKENPGFLEGKCPFTVCSPQGCCTKKDTKTRLGQSFQGKICSNCGSSSQAAPIHLPPKDEEAAASSLDWGQLMWPENPQTAEPQQ